MVMLSSIRGLGADTRKMIFDGETGSLNISDLKTSLAYMRTMNVIAAIVGTIVFGKIWQTSSDNNTLSEVATAISQ